MRGATVATGYVDNPQATRDAFHDGWFRTGDLGRLDGTEIFFHRAPEGDDQSRREKIVPSEVDAVVEFIQRSARRPPFPFLIPPWAKT